MSADYIKTAKSKGLSESAVIYGHAIRNAILPVVSYMGPLVIGILTGSFIIEKIFGIPGLGNEFVVSITNRTIPSSWELPYFSVLFYSFHTGGGSYLWIVRSTHKSNGERSESLMTQVKLEKSDFEALKVDHAEAEKIVGKSTSFWKDAWRRFRKNKLAIFGIVVIILLAIMAFIGTPISGESYDKTNLMNANKSLSADHWFGTDNLGRDVFARTWYGAKISLFIGLMASLIDLVIGVIWGGCRLLRW